MVSPASTKALAGQAELTRKMEELQKKLDEEVKKRQKLEPSRVGLERQLEEKAEECHRLQELLERRKGEVQQSSKELQNMKLLLGQEEGLRHGLEAQVKELQLKLKHSQSPDSGKESLLKDLLDTRELLEELLEGKQRVEEQLRLRERELTALKGALKEEVASHDQEVEHVRLEAELDEEKNTVELLTDRVNRGRDQVDQLRTELMQERSARQDLECDKISLERQNKDLKTRLASSEGFQKPSASLSQLESQNQLLQERLQAEEREKTVLQSTNRKLERRVKELSIQIDDERQHVNDQKDQLTLRVKALKRQVDEAEEEIERLDSLRKKAQRELEEQHEVNEQLQARIKSLEKDAWRKASRSAAESALKQEGLSSDEEFDNVYDPSSIASLLTESNLQTSSC